MTTERTPEERKAWVEQTAAARRAKAEGQPEEQTDLVKDGYAIGGGDATEAALQQQERATPARGRTPKGDGIGLAEAEFNRTQANVNPYTGIEVPADTFVVLGSLLGKRGELLPPREGDGVRLYHVPGPHEYGDVVSREELSRKEDTWDNVERLLAAGTIARLDHPDAAEAIRLRQSRPSLT